jgi:hypothetical protein
MGLALIVLPVMLKITAPYGRHTTAKWGPLVNNRLGWFIMEMPVIVIFTCLFFGGDAEKTVPVYIFYLLFMVHYFHRVFIFPLRLRGKNRRMPLVVVLLAIAFNLCNGFFNGYWFGVLNDFYYPTAWLKDWRFIFGVLFFTTGMYLNITSDQRLISLRNETREYSIPYGGFFRFVSCPNLLGEIIEWLGWALMCWCLPAISFALWTLANLIPRALDHHRWYNNYFKEYPKERKAVFPFLL